MLQSVRRRRSEPGGDEAGEDGGHDGGDIGIDVERFVLDDGGGEVHHAVEDEERFEVVGDFVGDILHEVGDELVEARIGPERGEGGDAVFFVGLVQQGGADLLEVELEFFGEDVFDQGLEADVVVAAHGGEVGIRAWSFGKKFLVAGVGTRGVLGDGRLNTFDCEPVCCGVLCYEVTDQLW